MPGPGCRPERQCRFYSGLRPALPLVAAPSSVRRVKKRQISLGRPAPLFPSGARHACPTLEGMRVLGVDCGSEATGYGLIESDGRRHRPLAVGTIRSNARVPFPERLNRIHQTLTALLLEYHPDCVAIEDVFYA